VVLADSRLHGRNNMFVQAKAVRRSYKLAPSSIHGLFKGGIVQMKGAERQAARLASKDHLEVFYALGGWGAKDLEVRGRKRT
jgi:hypothetical protein